MTKKKSNKYLIWEIIVGALLAILAIIWETKKVQAQKKSNKRTSR